MTPQEAREFCNEKQMVRYQSAPYPFRVLRVSSVPAEQEQVARIEPWYEAKTTVYPILTVNTKHLSPWDWPTLEKKDVKETNEDAGAEADDGTGER